MQRFLVVLCVLLLASFAEARKIVIIQATRVELRPSVETPDGRVEEYIVIIGNPAIIKVDTDEIIADRIEYNKSTRKLRIVGAGIFQGKNDTIAGRDFEVDLETEGLSATDVLIATKEIDVQGIDCTRLPGQVDVQNGYFSPCSRCGTTTDAYGFKAGQITLYPGDRLVARDVTIMLGGLPIMYLPIVVVFLSEPSRYPKLELNLNLEIGSSRPNVGLDLPFSIGENGFGYWLLRYYAARTPAFGVGFNVSFANVGNFSNKARATLLMLPPQSGTELQWAFRFAVEDARIVLLGREPEDRWSDLQLSISLTRADAGTSRELRNFPNIDVNQTALDFSLKWSAARYDINALAFGESLFNLELVTNALFPIGAALPSSRTQYRPELRFTAGKPLLPRFGALTISSWQWKAAWITAPFNPLNPSAIRFANGANVISALRFSFGYALTLSQDLWAGAKVNGSSSFRARYYSTRNSSDPNAATPDLNGEFERNLIFNASLGVQQTVGTWLDIGINSRYDVSRGETPFSGEDEPSSNQDGSGNIGLSFNLRPLNWLSLAATQPYNFRVGFRSANNDFNGTLEPLSATLTLNPRPISFVFNGQYNLETAKPVAYSLSLGVSGNTSFSVGFGYTFPTASSTGAFQNLKLALGYSTTNRAFSVSLSLEQNLVTAQITSTNLNSSWIIGSVENPITLSLNQSYVPAINTSPNTLNGSLGVRYTFASSEFDRPFFTGIEIQFANQFNDAPFIPQGANAPSSTVRLQASLSGQTPLALTFSSNLDLKSFIAYNPNLTASFSLLRGSAFEFGINLGLSLPNPNTKEWLWNNLSLNFAWDIRAGLSVFGDIGYNRRLSNGVFIDSFNVRSLGVALAFAVGGVQRPNLFFVVNIAQNFTFQTDPRFTATTVFQPAFIVIYDQCCYSIIASLKPVSPNNAGVAANYVFSLVLSLPYGTQTIVSADRDFLRLPVLPFIDPIPAPKP